MIILTLNALQQSEGEDCGDERTADSIRHGRRRDNTSVPDINGRRENDRDSACAEYAVALATGGVWVRGVCTFHKFP